MREKGIWLISGLTPLVAGLLLISYGEARGANCDALWQEAKSLRHPLPQRDLLLGAIKKCANHAGLQYEYAYSLERLRHYDAALDHYQQALSLEPGLAKAWFGRGDVALLLGDYRQAISSYEQGLTLNPENARGRRSLADALGKMGAAVAPPPPLKTPAKRGDHQPLTQAAIPPPPSPAAGQTLAPTGAPDSSPGAKPADAESLDSGLQLLQTTVIGFRNASEELSAEAKAQLDSVGAALASSQLRLIRVEVGGHTDNLGPLPVNMALSRRRAEAVVNYLTSRCAIPASRLIPVAHGPKQPQAPPGNDNNRLNRRVQFKPLPAG